jgi:succinate dehydrogenase hydrophobic anchor subunit
MKKSLAAIFAGLILASLIIGIAQTKLDNPNELAEFLSNSLYAMYICLLLYIPVVLFFSIHTFIGTRKIIAARKAKAANNKDE